MTGPKRVKERTLDIRWCAASAALLKAKMFSHIGYIEYCEKYCFKTNIKDLNIETDYYWHNNFCSNVTPLKFIRLNGNTFIFQMEKGGKLGLSSEEGIIYGLTTNKSINLFPYWKYN